MVKAINLILCIWSL